MQHILKSLMIASILWVVGMGQARAGLPANDQPRFRAGLSSHVQLSHLDFSPQALFQIHKQFQGVLSLHLLKYGQQSPRSGQMSYGFGLGVRYFPVSNLFAECSLEQFNIPVRREQDLTFTRGQKADVLLGIGYMQDFGKKFSGSLSVHWNANYKTYSAYENRLILKAALYRSF